MSVESKPETILIAEDSAPNRRILTHLIEKMGYEAVACEDGKIALEAYQKGIPNLVAVVSDIMMPNMDGIELLEAVRTSDTDQKNLPFFLCTAVMDKEYILKSKSLGVNAYIVKPITYDKLKSKLTEVFPDKKWPRSA
ncbi:MAG: response regulator [Bdellovibrionales bacterium]